VGVLVTVSAWASAFIGIRAATKEISPGALSLGRLAIALAREGGIGILHRNLSIEAQIDEVDKVKRSESGMIVEPVTLAPGNTVAEALELMERYRISGVPITDEAGVLVGILTNRDLRFETDSSQPVSALMTARDLVALHVQAGIELRVVRNLWPLWHEVVASTLEFSGIRLHNALPPP
jgi:IMP dehydrogenase